MRISLRELMPSLVNTLRRCHSTVRELMNSWLLISGLLCPLQAPSHPWTRRRSGISAAQLAAAPLVSREGGSGTRDTLAAALAAVLGAGHAQAPAALSVCTTAAVRAAVLAGAAPAVISDLAVADDLAAGRLAEVRAPELDLRRALRVIWAGPANPPAGAARDLVAHIASRTTSL